DKDPAARDHDIPGSSQHSPRVPGRIPIRPLCPPDPHQANTINLTTLSCRLERISATILFSERPSNTDSEEIESLVTGSLRDSRIISSARRSPADRARTVLRSHR